MDNVPSEAADSRIGPGTVVLVVGPSGAGKDSLIAIARERLEQQASTRFVFPARIVTRPAHTAEPHRPLSEADYEEQAARGAFGLSWQAHGLAYAIPGEIDEDVRAGRTVVINTSRAVVTAARERYARVRVVLIDAPSEVRAERLAARGRETREEIDLRLARAVAFDPRDADAVIDNGGDLDAAAGQFLAWLKAQ